MNVLYREPVECLFDGRQFFSRRRLQALLRYLVVAERVIGFIENADGVNIIPVGQFPRFGQVRWVVLHSIAKDLLQWLVERDAIFMVHQQYLAEVLLRGSVHVRREMRAALQDANE